MSAALFVLGGIAYIGCSLFFKFTPRLRVVVALVVGGLLAGVVARFVTHWLAAGATAIAGPIGHLIGQPAHDVAVAIPSTVALVLSIVVVVFLRRKGGGGHAGGGKHGHSGGGGKAGLATAALVCALLLPIVAGSVGEVIRSVTA